jgi:hypothetical protein
VTSGEPPGREPAPPTHGPGPYLAEARRGLWTAGALVTSAVVLVGAGFLAFCLWMIQRSDQFGTGGSSDESPAHAVHVVLRILVVFVVAVGPALLVGLRRRARRRSLGPRDGVDGRVDGPAIHARRSADAGRRCPFCKDDLGAGDLSQGVVRCPGCEVSHHTACWREHGGCSTHGCRRDPRQRDSLREHAGR